MSTGSPSVTDSWKYETCPECEALVQVRGNSDAYVKVSQSVSESSDDLRGEIDYQVFYHRRCTPMDDVTVFDD